MLLLEFMELGSRYFITMDLIRYCKIYTDVYSNPKYSKLSQVEKDTLISEKVESSVFSVDAIETFSAVATADPLQKYQLFKESAEYSLKRNWECPEMAKSQEGYNSKH